MIDIDTNVSADASSVTWHACGHCHVVMQAAQQDLAYAEAVSHRFEAGTALNPGRAQAEEQYADSLVLIGHKFNNSKALAIAAESYMNLSPWDYYIQVPGHLPSIVLIRCTLRNMFDIFSPITTPCRTTIEHDRRSRCCMLCACAVQHMEWFQVLYVMSYGVDCVCVCSPISCGLQRQKLRCCWWRRWSMMQISH